MSINIIMKIHLILTFGAVNYNGTLLGDLTGMKMNVSALSTPHMIYY